MVRKILMVIVASGLWLGGCSSYSDDKRIGAEEYDAEVLSYEFAEKKGKWVRVSNSDDRGIFSSSKALNTEEIEARLAAFDQLIEETAKKFCDPHEYEWDGKTIVLIDLHTPPSLTGLVIRGMNYHGADFGGDGLSYVWWHGGGDPPPRYAERLFHCPGKVTGIDPALRGNSGY